MQPTHLTERRHLCSAALQAFQALDAARFLALLWRLVAALDAGGGDGLTPALARLTLLQGHYHFGRVWHDLGSLMRHLGATARAANQQCPCEGDADNESHDD
jgi:hypothetical protein